MSIGICYEGGLDENGKPADTRIFAQKVTMEELLKSVLALVLRRGWRRLNLSFSPEGVS